MNLELKLSKAEYEPVLLDLVNRALRRDVPRDEVQYISVTYRPDDDNVMLIILHSPGPDQ